jgi:hypothetical protein
MKMIKRTLIAIAVVALLATSAHAALTEHYFPIGDHHAVKVDGEDKVRWPYEYKALTVCSIPIKMHVGMYVQVKDCKKKKIIIKQVACSDLGDVTGGVVSKGDGDFPCYNGCVKFSVRANFEVKMSGKVDRYDDTIKDHKVYYKGGDVVPGDGNYHEVEACIAAWKAIIWKASPGNETEVGKLLVQVKPNA